MEMMLLKCYTAIQFVSAFLAHRWWVVVAVLLLVVLFGRRVYCRFVCPLGLAQDLVRGFRGRRRVCSRLDRANVYFAPCPGGARAALALMRYALRLSVLIAFLAVGLLGLGWQWLDPYAILSRAVCFFAWTEYDGVLAAIALAPVAVILLLAFLAGERLWCNWVCPVGTVFAMLGAFPWKGDSVKKCAGCEKCRKCFK